METVGQSVTDLIQRFVSGGRDASHLWRDLAGRGKLHQGLRELVAGAEAAIGPDPLSSLNRCWELLSQPEAEQQLHRYHLADHGVDVGRICRHARALVAVAQAGVALRQTISHPDAWERLLEWWRKAGELLTDSRLLPAAGVPSCGFDLTEPERLGAALDCVAPFGWPVGALRLWTRNLLRLPDGSLRRLRIPILGVTAGDEGFVADLQLVLLLNDSGGDLIEEPETALRPFGGDLLRVLGEQHRRHAAANSISWTLTMRPTVHKPQFAWMALDGKSLGAAAAVGFHLLMHNGIYDGGCAITAAVGQSGGDPLEDELAGVEGLEAKLRALVAWNQENPQGVIRRVALAARDDKRPAGIVERYAGSLQLTLLDKVGAAVQFASEEVEQLRQYLRELIEAPDREYIPGKPEGIKPSELYIEPDVFKREHVLSATRRRGAIAESNESHRITVQTVGPESLDLGENAIYGEGAQDWPRERWSRTRERLAGHLQRFAVVLGPPGAGKTTLASYTARALATEALYALETYQSRPDSVALPIVLTLPSLTEYRPQFSETPETALKCAIQNALKERGCLLPQPLLKATDQANTWLFLDALDEVEGDRKPILQAYLHVLEDWRCRVIVTSRPYAWQTWAGLFSRYGVVEYRLAPLDDNGVETFISIWFRNSDEKRISTLQLVQLSSALASLSRLPFLLALLCAVQAEGPVASDTTRSDLYARFLEVIFGTAERARNWRRWLEELTWSLFQKSVRRTYVTADELEDCLFTSQYRPRPLGISDPSLLTAQQQLEILLQELKGTRLLIPYAGGQAFVFPHRSIAEFLMGSALARSAAHESVWKLVDAKAWDPDWKHVLLFFAGTLSDVFLVRKLLRLWSDELKDDVFRHRLGLAALSLSEIQSPKIAALFDEVNKVTTDTIGTWWHHQVKEPDDAAELCRTMGWIHFKGTSPVVKHLHECLPALAQRKGEINGTPIVKWLSSLLQDRRPSIRGAAAVLVRDCGPAIAEKPILERLAQLLNDADVDTQWKAVWALGQLGPLAASPEILSSLTNLLAADDPELRGDAGACLKVLCPSPPPRREVIERLLVLLADPDPWCRQRALYGLGHAHEAVACRAVLARVSMLLEDENEWVRNEAADAIQFMGKAAGEPEILRSLSRLLLDESHIVRTAVEQALGRLSVENTDAAVCLINLLHDNNHTVRVRALISVLWAEPDLQSQAMAREVWRALYDDNLAVRRKALRVLETMPRPAVVTDYIHKIHEFLCETDTAIRIAALGTLRQAPWLIPNTETVEILGRILKNPKVGVSADIYEQDADEGTEAIWTLAAVAARRPELRPSALSALRSALSPAQSGGIYQALCETATLWARTGVIPRGLSEHNVLRLVLARIAGLLWARNQRIREAEALGLLGRDVFQVDSMLRLYELLGDSDARVREKAVEAIGSLGAQAWGVETAAHLCSVLADQSPLVREAAARTVASFGKLAAEPEIMACIGRLLSDETYSVWAAASEAVKALGESAATIGAERVALLLNEASERDRALEMLEMMGNLVGELVATRVAGLLQMDSVNAQSAGLTILAHIGVSTASPGVIRKLRRLLVHQDEGIREKTAQALAKMMSDGVRFIEMPGGAWRMERVEALADISF